MVFLFWVVLNFSLLRLKILVKVMVFEFGLWFIDVIRVLVLLVFSVLNL